MKTSKKNFKRTLSLLALICFLITLLYIKPIEVIDTNECQAFKDNEIANFPSGEEWALYLAVGGGGDPLK
ncbi:MAG: hypothetical protein GF353_10635 [Candidatus Lokiarchaeota archaeon]|nr:hypothetical protein [Candidatus Lokiarchaeota archaeon]